MGLGRDLRGLSLRSGITPCAKTKCMPWSKLLETLNFSSKGDARRINTSMRLSARVPIHTATGISKKEDWFVPSRADFENQYLSAECIRSWVLNINATTTVITHLFGT